MVKKYQRMMTKDASKFDMNRDFSKDSEEEEEDRKAQEEEIRENLRIRKEVDYSKIKLLSGPQMKTQKERLLENILFYKNILKYEKKIAEKMAIKAKVKRTRRLTSIPGRNVFSGESKDD